jgi:hypothetical protein
MKKATRWNSTLPVSAAPLKRKKPVKKRNEARIKKRKTDAFGEGKAAFVRSFACAVSTIGVAHSVFDKHAAHIKSRGAGGSSKHLIPLCGKHHAEQHAIGIKSFAAKYGLDLEALAAKYEVYWQDSPVNPKNSADG